MGGLSQATCVGKSFKKGDIMFQGTIDGGDLVLGGAETPLPPSDGGTDMAGATERVAAVVAEFL